MEHDRGLPQTAESKKKQILLISKQWASVKLDVFVTYIVIHSNIKKEVSDCGEAYIELCKQLASFRKKKKENVTDYELVFRMMLLNKQRN